MLKRSLRYYYLPFVVCLWSTSSLVYFLHTTHNTAFPSWRQLSRDQKLWNETEKLYRITNIPALDEYRAMTKVESAATHPKLAGSKTSSLFKQYQHLSKATYIRASQQYDSVSPRQQNFNSLTYPKACAHRPNGLSTNKCTLSSCNPSEPFPSTGFWIHHGEHTANNNTRLSSYVQTMAMNGCAVSHKYKFVYIHVLKSGGMTFKSFLKMALCGNTTRMPCQRGSDVLQVVHCHKVLSDPVVYADYLIWSVIRNPYSRLYSGYAMAREAARQRGRSNDDDHVFTFDDFVQFPAKRRQYSTTDPIHYQPQYQFLFSAHHHQQCPVPVVDFVVRMETLSHDMPILLALLSSPELTVYYQQYGLHAATDTDYGRHRKERELGGDLRRAYYPYDDSSRPPNHNTGTSSLSATQEAALREYATDFELFHYDKTVIPFV